MVEELRELIKRQAQVDSLLNDYDEEGIYALALLCEKYELTQKIRKLYNQLRRCERQPEC